MICERVYWTAYLACHLRGQAGYPFQPLDRILADQARRVRAMAAYAYRYVPYYRETMDRLGLRPADFAGADDLARLPILERDELQRDPDYFGSTARPAGGSLPFHSGGTSNVPLAVHHDGRALLQNAAHGERERSIYSALVGRWAGYREAVIALGSGSAFQAQRYCQQHAFLPSGVRVCRLYLSVLDPAEKNLHLLREFRPDIIQSYGSYLGILFAHMQASGLSLPGLKLVSYSSDGLGAHGRRLIEREFGVPVFSTYQAIEAFKIGFECERHQGWHLNVDLYPLRLVDGAGGEVPAGERGEVIVSNLVNRATVLLNYRLGDVAALSTDPCPCGRRLPLLRLGLGRRDDCLRLPSSNTVSPADVQAVLAEEGIWQYQLVQHTWTEVSLEVVPGATCKWPEVAARIEARLALLLGHGVSVAVRPVSELQRTAHGKLRPIISRWASESDHFAEEVIGAPHGKSQRIVPPPGLE